MAARKRKTTKRPRQSKSRLVDQIELKFIRLLDVNANLHIAGGKLPIGSANINVGTEWGLNEEDRNLLARVNVSVEGSDPDTGSKLSITFTHQAAFRYDTMPALEKIPKEQRDEINSLAVMLTWPYARELVQSITTRMNLPGLPLPLMRIEPAPRGSSAPTMRPPKKTVRKAQKS